MSSENTLTGRNGKHVVADSLVARCKEWSVSQALASSSEWGDSDSGGYTNRASGRRDCTFESEGVYDSTDEIFDLFAPGDILESTLWLSGSVAGLYWHFPRALCDDFSLTVDIDTEEVIGWESSWGADGIFYRPGEDGSPSESLPA